MKTNIKIEAMNKMKFPIWLFALLLLSGCVKDDLFHTGHPQQGAVRVTTTWDGHSSDAVLPLTYVLRLGSEEQTVTGATNVFGSLFFPGKQFLSAYNNPAGFTVSGTTATVGTQTDGSLDPTPDNFFAATDTLDIQADAQLDVTLPMKQYTRQLILTLYLSAGDERRISTTSSTLTGVASSVDFSTGHLSATAGHTLHPSFVLGTGSSTRATAAPQSVLTATIRLLGVDTAEKQQLTVNVMMTNGTAETVTSDITDALKNFSVGTLDPLILNATLTLSSDAGIHASIHDWTVVDNGDVNIH